MTLMKPPPNPDNYTLSKGIVYLAPWSSGGAGDYADVGNCSDFTFQPTEETLEHFSSREGTKKQDAEATIQSGGDLTFTLDEPHIENMRKFGKATRSGKSLYFNMNLGQYWCVRFSERNPEGPRKRWEFWKVKLAPAGAIALIGDDWQTMQFSGKVLADETNHPESSQVTVIFTTTTTTTSSTTTTTTSA